MSAMNPVNWNPILVRMLTIGGFVLLAVLLALAAPSLCAIGSPGLARCGGG